MSYGDILVVCEESGLVMLLEKVVDPVTLEFSVQTVYKDGAKAWVQGFACPACRIQLVDAKVGQDVYTTSVAASGKPSCRYRPLRGPLHVPR